MSDLLTYVNASAQLLGLPLADGQAQRVAAHLERTAAMAELLDGVDLSVDVEIVEVYCPKAPLPPSNRNS